VTELPTPRTPAGAAGLRALTERPQEALMAFDFDGVLSPIIDDPERAVAHPGAVPALSRLAGSVGALAIVTGRPVQTVVGLGGFADVPELSRLYVLGHYGEERWDPRTGAITAPPAPAAVAEVRERLPGLLEQWGAPAGTAIEDKQRAVAVHFRRTADPVAATERLAPRLVDLAERYALTAQPGRYVVELKPSGMDKGRAIQSLVAELQPRCVSYVGDDLGDLPAFAAIDSMRSEGLLGLLVCSGSAEVALLADRADLVLDGPAGVVGFLEALAERLV
jgi:trehalose 6-phosphate phosphatase